MRWGGAPKPGLHPRPAVPGAGLRRAAGGRLLPLLPLPSTRPGPAAGAAAAGLFRAWGRGERCRSLLSRLRAGEPGRGKQSLARWPASFLSLLRRLPRRCRACACGRRGGDPRRTKPSSPCRQPPLLWWGGGGGRAAPGPAVGPGLCRLCPPLGPRPPERGGAWEPPAPGCEMPVC